VLRLYHGKSCLLAGSCHLERSETVSLLRLVLFLAPLLVSRKFKASKVCSSPAGEITSKSPVAQTGVCTFGDRLRKKQRSPVF